MDKTTRDELVVEHLPLVTAIAKRIRASLPMNVSLDDLVGPGQLGLMGAAELYNPARVASFSTYAKHRIRGAILDYLRSLDTMTRDDRRLTKAIERLQHETHETASPAEVAAHLDITEDRAIELLATRRSQVSLDQPINEDTDSAARTVEAHASTRPDAAYGKQELSGVLRNLMDEHLSPRYQMVVELYYAGEMTMREIGATMVPAVNESRVSQIHKSAIDKLRDAMEARALTESDFAHA